MKLLNLVILLGVVALWGASTVVNATSTSTNTTLLIVDLVNVSVWSMAFAINLVNYLEHRGR